MSAIGIVGAVMILAGVGVFFEQRRYATNIYRRIDRPYRPGWHIALYLIGLALIATQSPNLF
jgi:ABC-type sulfate transport system permease component